MIYTWCEPVEVRERRAGFIEDMIFLAVIFFGPLAFV